MFDKKNFKAQTLVNPNARIEAKEAMEAQKIYDALKSSKEAENLKDAFLATLKGLNANKK